MSYDKNSPEAHKGAMGEAIVKKFLESWGAVVTRPDEYGEKSLVDFLAVPGANQKFAARYVEVKVRSALPYAYGQYLCYTFPVVQIEAYKRYMEENNLPVELWLVDPEKAEILLGTLDKRSPVCIENKIFIDGREFPFNQKTKFGLMRFYHFAQFGGHFKISDDDLAKLRTIEIPTANHKKQTQPQEQKVAVADKTLSLKIKDTLTAPNGTVIELLTLEGNTRFFIKVARLSLALGYATSSVSVNSPLMKAAERLKVEWYRFPLQRLSGDAAHTKKAYYFDLADVPKVLAKYCELHCKAKSGSRQALYNSEAQKLCDRFQSFVLPKYFASNKVEPKLNAVLRPFESLHTPNGKQLSLFLTKEGAFFHLSQLETAGVDLSCIRRRFELKNYEGELAH